VASRQGDVDRLAGQRCQGGHAGGQRPQGNPAQEGQQSLGIEAIGAYRQEWSGPKRGKCAYNKCARLTNVALVLARAPRSAKNFKTARLG
jgi:hypothetical protein